jgi:hypothetical protein
MDIQPVVACVVAAEHSSKAPFQYEQIALVHMQVFHQLAEKKKKTFIISNGITLVINILDSRGLIFNNENVTSYEA